MTESEFFAFTHGIRLALKAHGHDIHDHDAIMPVFQTMQGIMDSPRNSLVHAHDAIPTEQFEARRQLEQEACQKYLGFLTQEKKDD